MIKSLLVRDFQSHQNSELEFVPGVNIVCGLSQSGKTALLRALNWVLNNRPLGDGFIRSGTKEVSVAVVVRRNKKDLGILRVKGEKDSNYTIVNVSRKKDDPTEDLIFRAFGSDVPKEVKDIFNLSDINIQDQLSPYFLVLDSPGQVALYIRQVSNLEKIDKIISIISGKVRTTSQDMERVKTDLAVTDVELKELQEIDLESFKRWLDEVEDLLQDEAKVGGDIRILGENLRDLEEVQDRLSQLNQVDFVYLSNILSECKDLESDYSTRRDEFNRLSSLLTELELIDSKIFVFSPDIEEKLSQVDILGPERTRISDELCRLVELEKDLEEVLVKLDDIKLDLHLLNKERDELLEQLTICPYCGEQLNEVSKACLLERV